MENEKRLIDANALCEKIGNMKYEITNNRGGYRYCNEDEKNEWEKLDSFDSLVCDATTVDAVEVVRCKDCKHYDNSEGICWCHLNSKFYPGGLDWHSFPEDGFCSYGERMEE